MILKLSDRVRLRPQQVEPFKAYFNDGIKNMLFCAHRRFGKGLGAFTLTCAAAIETRGIYGYFLPTIGQSRKVIWQTIGSDGVPLIERPHPELIAKVNSTEQMITMKNGSLVYVGGSDNYKRYIGMDFRFLVWDEYQDSNPAAVDSFRPMIRRNNGFMAFLGTPRPYSHFKELYDEHVDDPTWFVRNLTIRDTVDEFGNPIITEEDIETERRNGMPEELIQQEYYGNWQAAVRGAYYSKQINAARNEGRIGAYPYNARFLVYTGWDLGYDDSTAIWWVQFYNGRFYLIDYYENREYPIEHYCHVIHAAQQKFGYRYSQHFAPHDVENHTVAAGKSVKDVARHAGINFRTVQRPTHKMEGITVVRHLFPKMYFNDRMCKEGLKHLTEYRTRYDEKNDAYSLQPHRNSATHGADALQTFCMGWMSSYDPAGFKQQREYANLYGTHIW